MDIGIEQLRMLEEVRREQFKKRLLQLRAEMPTDKEPFEWDKFLQFSYGDDFKRTPEQLEYAYLTAFAEMRTLEDFVSAMVEYTY